MKFWNKRKVLVTGHTGFKGSWLSLWLQAMDADVVGFSLPPPTTPNLFTLANIADGMTSIIGDIRDFTLLQGVIEKYQPEIIFHLAAQPLVRYSYHQPVNTYSTNVMGTVHLFEAARQVDCVKSIVNITTDKCYENLEWHWSYRENDRLGGYDPYSNSKACSELVTGAYRSSFYNALGVGIASARAGNVIGGGDWALDRLVPDIIRACMNKQPVIIRNPHALRPWQHVLDPLNGYLQLAQRLYETGLTYSDSWNFGPVDNDVKPVGWIVDYIVRNWGNGAHWILDEANHPHEASNLKLDCAKAKTKLNWHTLYNLEKALDETIDWYKGYQAGANIRDTTVIQIKNFMSQTKNEVSPKLAAIS